MCNICRLVSNFSLYLWLSIKTHHLQNQPKHMDYYVIVNGQQQGPMTREQLREMNISSETLVWYDGLKEWTPAGQAPETADLCSGQQTTPPPFSGRTTPPPPTPTPRPAAAPQQQPAPDTYLVWAILATIFCCLPFGIVAIVKSTGVNNALSRGDYAAAQEASKDAKKWCIIAAIVGVAGSLLYILMFAIIGGAAALGY
jgi:hypothetical protein